MPAKAQLSDNGYANVDWQFNAPLKNHFADKASGWGMNFEGGYFVTPNLGLGLFMNYSSNHEYFPRATFPVGEGTVNTDQQHTFWCRCTLSNESWRSMATLFRCQAGCQLCESTF